MTIGNVVFMCLILGIVWGGFAYCIVQLSRQKDDGS